MAAYVISCVCQQSIEQDMCPVSASIMTTSSLYLYCLDLHCTRSGNSTEVPKSCEQGCYIRVGSEAKRGWEEGKCLVFDDSFEHEANLLKEHCCVLFFNLAMPMTPAHSEVL